MAACLWAGHRAVVSHRSAGALWGLDGVPQGVVEITVPTARRSPGGIRVHCTAALPGRDVARLDRIPVTTVARTLVDLAGVLPVPSLEHALDAAVRRGHTTVSAIVEQIDDLGAHGRRGTAALRRIISERLPGESVPESVLERKLLRVLAAGGLPAPICQYRVTVRGRVVARLDFAYPDLMIGIEADGYAYHSARAAWERDRVRSTELTSLGWHLLGFTWREVDTRPQIVVARIQAARDRFSLQLRPEGERNREENDD